MIVNILEQVLISGIGSVLNAIAYNGTNRYVMQCLSEQLTLARQSSSCFSSPSSEEHTQDYIHPVLVPQEVPDEDEHDDESDDDVRLGSHR